MSGGNSVTTPPFSTFLKPSSSPPCASPATPTPSVKAWPLSWCDSMSWSRVCFTFSSPADNSETASSASCSRRSKSGSPLRVAMIRLVIASRTAPR